MRTTSEERFNLPPQPDQACPLIDEVIMGITDKLGDVGDIARNLDFGQEQQDLLDIARYDEFREQLNEIRKRIEDIREWGQHWKNLAKGLSNPKAETKSVKRNWVCNECNFANFTESVPEHEIEQELHACIHCGGFEFHLEPIRS